MKRNIILTIVLLLTFSIVPSYSFAVESDLIQEVQISLKNAETPKRIEVSFNLKEPIDLSQGSSNIIFEYFKKNSDGNLEALNYKKDKSWSGYLNSYDNYPSGENKYSSGYENASYSNNVPVTRIYTSTKTNANIDITLVDAVRIIVLRSDGSGEKVVIYSDGTTSGIEKIEIPVVHMDQNTGIKLESTTAELPTNTVLIANELTYGFIYEKASAVLVDVKDFIVFEIKLESDGNEIQPNGKVKISIPIPENFDTSNLSVYRIDIDGTKTFYPVTVTVKEEVEHATFETNHFSTYVLADVTKEEAEKDGIPITCTTQIICYIMVITIIFLIVMIALLKKS